MWSSHEQSIDKASTAAESRKTALHTGQGGEVEESLSEDDHTGTHTCRQSGRWRGREGGGGGGRDGGTGRWRWEEWGEEEENEGGRDGRRRGILVQAEECVDKQRMNWREKKLQRSNILHEMSPSFNSNTKEEK